MQSSENIRFIFRAEFAFQRDPGKEYFEPLFHQLIVHFLRQNAVLRAVAFGVRLLITQEDIERLLTLRDLQDPLLDLRDVFRLLLIIHPAQRICLIHGLLVVRIVRNAPVLHAMTGRDPPAGHRVVDILNTVTAQNERPVQIGVGTVSVIRRDQPGIGIRRFIKIAELAKMMRTVDHKGRLLVVDQGQCLPGTAKIASTYGRAGFGFQLTSAHLTCIDRHNYSFPTERSRVLFFLPEQSEESLLAFLFGPVRFRHAFFGQIPRVFVAFQGFKHAGRSHKFFRIGGPLHQR